MKKLPRDFYLHDLDADDLDLLAREALQQKRSLNAQLCVEIHKAATRIYRRRFRQAADELAAAKKGKP